MTQFRVTPAEAAMIAIRRDGLPGPKPRRPVTRKEKDIQAAILAYLKLVPGVVAWKAGGGLLPLADGRRVRMGAVGVSDIVGFWAIPEDRVHHLRGYALFLAIEVKREGRHPTQEQAAFLKLVTDSGGIAIVARSVEDVRRVVAP